MKQAFLLISVLLTALPVLGAELAPGWRHSESGDLVHIESGLVFPHQWKTLTRVEPRTFDQEGRNVSIGYNGSSPHLALTLYIYPPDFGGVPDPEEHFKGAVQAAVQLNSPAQLEKAARMDLPLGDATVKGYNAFLYWREADGEVGSFLVLIPQERRFFKIRITFELDGEAAPMQHAWVTLQAFLRSLDVPHE